jgi:hypothetical protein
MEIKKKKLHSLILKNKEKTAAEKLKFPLISVIG